MTTSRRALLRQSAAAGGSLLAAGMASARVEPPATSPRHVRHRRVRVGELDIFYREAGPAGAPVLLLLHGFPSSSFMFRELLPALADRWRVIAPDYPGFGESSFPAPASFPYTFENLARVLIEFTDAIGLTRYTLYLQDYGAPLGLRLAVARPQRVRALIVQNGNAYREGLSSAWDPLRAYWQAPTAENRNRLRGWLTFDGVRQQYLAGLPPALVERVSPDTWTLDWSRLSRPGNLDAQLDLFADYRKNVALYPTFQRYLESHQPPTLIAWGRYDPFFLDAGARAYLRDVPRAELTLFDAGHFALETHGAEIGERIRHFLGRAPA
jgi:pimeloyl-ACP methyl ester carboxylesterase